MTERKRRYQKFRKDGDNTDSSDSDYGPQLPQHLSRKSRLDEAITEEAYGPALPQLARPDRSENNLEGVSEVIGPALPPHLQKNQSTLTRIDTSQSQLETCRPPAPVIGPVLPNDEPRHVIGPVVPPQMNSSQSDLNPLGPALPQHLAASLSEDTEPSCSGGIGPALPAHLQNNQSGHISADELAVVGPVLPPHLLNRSSSGGLVGPTIPPHLTSGTSSTRTERILGPSLPPGFVPPSDSDSEEEQDESFGPDPRLMHTGDVSFDAIVAARAEKARRKMLGLDEKKIVRENWMLELPPERGAIANLGLAARQFRAKPAPDLGDRTVWTDTPADAAKKLGQPSKQDDEALVKQQRINERDLLMEKMARKAEKKAKRNESLLDIHSKKINNEAKEEAKKNEGQPVLRKMFNREEDMHVHRFDEAQKKAIFKKAQMLNDRFSRGESKFL